MNIENIQALIAQGLLTDVASLDLTTTYVTVGVYQPGNRQNGPSGNAYPSYVLPLSQLAGTTYTASNGIVLVGNDFQLGSLLISQFTNDSGYITSGGGTTDLDPVISQTNVVPGSPVSGDRYLAGTTPGAPWTANSIEEWDGASWITTAPVLDDVVFVTSTLSTLRYNGSAWVPYVGTAVLNQGNTTGSALVIGTNTAQAMVFKTNNVESARIVSGGSWGFGTITPSAKVTVKGQTSDTTTIAFDVRNSSNILIASFRNDGYIGVGTASPNALMDIVAANATPFAFSIRNSTYTANTAFGYKVYQKNDGYISFYMNGSEYMTVSPGKNVSYSTSGYISTDSQLTTQAPASGAASYGFYCRGYLSNNGLSVDGDGNVGINQFTATAKLHVQGVNSAFANYALRVDNASLVSLFSVANNGSVGINAFGGDTLYSLTLGSKSTGAIRMFSSSFTDMLTIKEASLGTIANYNFFGGTRIGIGAAANSANSLFIEAFSGLSTDYSLNIGSVGSLSTIFAIRNDGRVIINGSSSDSPSGINTAIFTSNLSGYTFQHSANVTWLYDANVKMFNAIGADYGTVGTFTSHDFYIRTNNTDRIFVARTTGNVGIGTTSASARLHVKGIDATSSNYALKVDNSSSSPLLYVRNDGNVGINGGSGGGGFAKFHVVSGNGDTALFESQASSVTGYAVKSLATSTNTQSNIALYGYASGGFANLGLWVEGGLSCFGAFNLDAKVYIKGDNANNSQYALKIDNSLSSPLLYVRNNGQISAPSLPTSNTGLVTGDIYVDTAANILANGDKVVGWKV